ncbi:DinB family protein [Paenibacillus thermotolerans]|uniref:DinB family protein n=1 Tax=Paenibacillus thermotolerans TaxID=3027807 RepID=UPI002367C7CD|nr:MULTISPECIES: DinB family protein [unclassified Paenibacillus]
MREAYLFERFEKSWAQLLQKVEHCPEDKRGVVPAGCNNNIHWHLGHILSVTDSILFGYTGQTGKVPNEFKGYFGNGTKPADWTGDVPSWETVTALLKEQPGHIRTAFQGKMNEPITKENFLKAETVEELLVGVLQHEAGHAGNIGTMLKLLA